MLRFLPVMFASGRVAYNRMLVTFVDALTIYSLYLSVVGEVNIFLALLFLSLMISFYMATSYTRYFSLVKKYDLIKSSISFDNGFISMNILVNDPVAGGNGSVITVPVKVPKGVVYQRYVLYVYMSLCNALTIYARKLKTGNE